MNKHQLMDLQVLYIYLYLRRFQELYRLIDLNIQQSSLHSFWVDWIHNQLFLAKNHLLTILSNNRILITSIFWEVKCPWTIGVSCEWRKCIPVAISLAILYFSFKLIWLPLLLSFLWSNWNKDPFSSLTSRILISEPETKYPLTLFKYGYVNFLPIINSKTIFTSILSHLSWLHQSNKE